MPLSRRRKKKNGKKVGNGLNPSSSRIDETSYADQPSGLTLQDLINVVAYQESQKSDDDPTKMKRPEIVGLEDEKETQDGQQ